MMIKKKVPTNIYYLYAYYLLFDQLFDAHSISTITNLKYLLLIMRTDLQ